MKNIPVVEQKRKPLTLLHNQTNPRTLRTLNSSIVSKQPYGDPLEISLPEVVFTEIEADQSYEIQLQIRNVTANSRSVKLMKPKDTHF